MKTFEIVRERPRFPGFLYRPDMPGPRPGMLLLHGSDGGYGDYWKFPDEPPFPSGDESSLARYARKVASWGYVAYGFCYFHADGLEGFDRYPPKELVDIEIAETAKALDWLKSCPFVAGGPVGLAGGSRGGEHALLLSSLIAGGRYTQPELVISRAPSDKVVAGFSLAAAKSISSGGDWPSDFPPAWKFEGKTLEPGEAIEIEKIQSPLLVMYTAKDTMWGPGVDPARLKERLEADGRSVNAIDFSDKDDPAAMAEQVMRGFDAARPEFVRFMDADHSTKEGTPSHQFGDRVMSAFMKKYLG